MKTTEEIKALISEKIAGQGTQVDLGGALPEILNALVEMASGGGGNKVLSISEPSEQFDRLSEEEAARAIGISVAQLYDLTHGKYSAIEYRSKVISLSVWDDDTYGSTVFSAVHNDGSDALVVSFTRSADGAETLYTMNEYGFE